MICTNNKLLEYRLFETTEIANYLGRCSSREKYTNNMDCIQSWEVFK